jgi:hypothetical protein
VTAHARPLILGLVLASFAATARADVVNFEDKTYTGSAQFYNGSDGAGGFTSGGAFFNNSYDPTFGSWSGWSYSKVNDPTDPGFLNQYAAITGTGHGGSGNYGVAFDFGTNSSYINLPNGTEPLSFYVTNTTYAYLSMKTGDQFARKFHAGDFFTLEIAGYSGANLTGSVTGTVNFDLARYATDNDNPINVWTLVNLAGLGQAQSIGFTMASSDTGQFGINTPTYFAMDDLTYVKVGAVPEPSTLALTATGLVVVAVGRLRTAAGRRRTT